ncbi:hypothetical protein GCM10007103_34130 [Salinimicrobium marinum]|uniref:Uncharacterized protein n=1 Tax=Salinimicrobium marinum TaxID=680283 RepID=A0A918W1Q6_9FLAO|nr:hypothetical protein [Salinimicrobium marinum]GHA50552.1 hypothetical protein GCM10007103_34130 [Salinimicrobium marinum]
MSKKPVLLVLCLIIVAYPVISIFQLEQTISEAANAAAAHQSLVNYQISVWVSWLVLVFLSIYYKWTQKRNIFFYFTYGFIVVAFSIFGYYTQAIVNNFDLPSRFEDNYTHGVFTGIINIITSGILTGFLQAGVWWFTRRWHRR